MVSEKRKGKSKKDEENPNPPSPIPEEASDEEAFEMKDLTKTVSWSESEDQGSSSRLQSKVIFCLPIFLKLGQNILFGLACQASN